MKYLVALAALMLLSAPANADGPIYGVRPNTEPPEILGGPFAYASMCYSIMSHDYPRGGWICETL